MPLEKATQRVLQMNAASSAEFCGDNFKDIRARSREIQVQWDVPQVDVYRETDRQIDGPHGTIPLRIYWPQQAETDKNLPLLVAYHGGGWVLGNLDIYDNFARHLCKYGESIVVSVDYRLAPEHQFPAGIDDSFAALNWVSQHAAELGGDSGKLCVAGDSAGGNISAVMCHMARQNQGPRLWKQLLFYPCVNLADGAGYPSRSLNGTDEYGLSESALEEYRSLYVDSATQYTDFRLSPILAQDFSDLPAALIITAEYDPLCDEGKQYADCLQEAGVHTEYRRYEGVTHGFMGQSGIVGLGLEALNQATAFLRKAAV